MSRLRPWYERHTAPAPERVEEETFDLADLVAGSLDAPLDPYEPKPDDAVLCSWDGPRSGGRFGHGVGWLSRRHPTSSLGHPVLVTHGGQALGPAEVVEVRPSVPPGQWDEVELADERNARTAAHPTIVAAIAAGYPVRIDDRVID